MSLAMSYACPSCKKNGIGIRDKYKARGTGRLRCNNCGILLQVNKRSFLITSAIAGVDKALLILAIVYSLHEYTAIPVAIWIIIDPMLWLVTLHYQVMERG